MKIWFPLATLIACAAASLQGAEVAPTATAINSLGIRLLATTDKPTENALLSPFSIQEALAMTYAGADGKTRDEMAKALHYPKDDAALNTALTSLQEDLNELHEQSEAAITADSRSQSQRAEPITLILANRLFVQSGLEFRTPFLELLRDSYHAPLEELDFAADPKNTQDRINGWIEEQTLKRIHRAIPEDALKKNTVLVLVNAIYLKAPWARGFSEHNTQPGPFHVKGGSTEDVPMMKGLDMHLGYAKRDGYTALTIPYSGSGLQFVVLLPDRVNGLANLAAKLTPELLAGCANLKTTLVDLWIPKFKLEPEVMLLSGQLKALGMKTAFGKTANFSRMAAGELYIQEVFHKTFFTLDEHGTEAATATAVYGAFSDGDAAAQIHIDRPFLIAIQHRKSGACLFLGRMTDPR